MAYNGVQGLRAEIAKEISGGGDSSLRSLDGRLSGLEGGARRGPRGRAGAVSGTVSFSQLQGQFAAILSTLEDADLPPTTQAVAGLELTESAAKKTWAEWVEIQRNYNQYVNHETSTNFSPIAGPALQGCRWRRKKRSAADPADSIYFSALKFRLVGPFRGGRADAVAGSLTDRNTFYFGATGGGLWKTIDGGSNWKNVSDGFFGGGVGAVAVAAERWRHRICGARGEHPAQQCIGGSGRNVAQRQRRPELAQPRVEGQPAYFADRHSSERPQYRLGGGDGSSFRAQYGTRCIQNDRWRKNLAPRACM